MSILIQNGRIIDPVTGLTKSDILIEGDTIRKVYLTSCPGTSGNN